MEQYDNIPSEHVVFIRNVASGMYLDVHTSNSDNVIQYPLHGGTNQQWYLQSNGDFYKLCSMYYTGNKSLSHPGDGDATGRNVQLADTDSAWLFRLVQNADGTWRILSLSGKETYAVTVDPNSDNNVFMLDYTGSEYQKWNIERNKKIYTNNGAIAQSYNRTAAVNYAEQYADIQMDDDKYDTPDYLSTGSGYCTNFVSQCLSAGGLSEIHDDGRTSDSDWFYDYIPIINQYCSSYTWGGAENFARHWGHDHNGQGQQRAYRTIKYNNLVEAYKDWKFIQRNVRPGDVLQLCSSTGVIHSMIVHRTNTPSHIIAKDIFYAQHTSNKKDCSLYQYLKQQYQNQNTSTGLIIHKINERS